VLWAAGLLNTKQSSNPSTAAFHSLADTLIYNLKSLSVVTSENDRTRVNTWHYNKVRELIPVKVLHISLLNTTVVAFIVLPLGSYAPMPAPSALFKTILELVLWNSLQSCGFITPDVINVIKMPSFQYFLYLGKQKKVIGGSVR